MATRRPTQADVALAAGVSRQLVSLVVRGDPHVAPGTRARVEAALRDLSYRPNSAARTLATNRSGQVAVLVPDLANPFYGELTQLLVSSLGRHGFTALISVGPDAPTETDALARFQSLGVDACVLVSPRVHADLIEETGTALPTVVVTHDLAVPHTALVRADNALGARLATRHLLARDYDPIVLVGPPPRSEGDSVHLRVHGYLLAMEAARKVSRVAHSSPSTGVREVATRLLAEHGAGLAMVCHDDLTALSVLMAISEAGLRPGADVGVTGFDNSSLAALPGVSLTSVDLGLTSLVDFVLSSILGALGSRDALSCEGENLVNPRLVVRGSTARD